MNKVLCIIPARGGSRRIPRKNVIPFKGKPLIAYSIRAVKESGIADVIMVSTDDKEIAETAVQYGAEVPFFRKSETSDDKSGIADVLLEVIAQYQSLGQSFDYVLCVLATAPLIRPDRLKEAFHLLTGIPEADSVCPVQSFSYPPQRCLVFRDGKLKMLHPENYSARSQDLEPLYHDCGQFFLFRTEALLVQQKLYTKNAVPIFLDETESQDIDNYSDLKIAELKYDLLQERKGK